MFEIIYYLDGNNTRSKFTKKYNNNNNCYNKKNKLLNFKNIF